MNDEQLADALCFTQTSAQELNRDSVELNDRMGAYH